MDEVHLKILHMIQAGLISAEEGEQLLDALAEGTKSGDQPGDGSLMAGQAPADETKSLPASRPVWAHRAGIYLLASGIVLIGLAGMATAWLVQGGSRLGWLACTLPLMVCGALIVALTWWSRTARWLHVRVRDRETRFQFSLPLPLRPAAWLARLARLWVARLQDTPIDELILGLAEMEAEGMLAVEVSEEWGEEVQIYFG